MEQRKQTKKNFIVLRRTYVMQFSITTRKHCYGISKLLLGKNPVYIQHVEGTAFTTIMIKIMEKNCKFCAGKRQSCDKLWYQHKDIHKDACGSPDNKIRNQTDCIMVNRWHCTNVCGMRSVRVAETEPDRFSDGQNYIEN